MRLRLTNLGPTDVPVVSDQGKLTAVVKSMDTQKFDSEDTVWVIGVKAGFVENIKKSVKIVLGAIEALLSRPKEEALNQGVLSFKLHNQGDKSVRVIPGTVETEFTLEPQAIQDCTAIDYIELRELGA